MSTCLCQPPEWTPRPDRSNCRVHSSTPSTHPNPSESLRTERVRRCTIHRVSGPTALRNPFQSDHHPHSLPLTRRLHLCLLSTPSPMQSPRPPLYPPRAPTLSCSRALTWPCSQAPCPSMGLLSTAVIQPDLQPFDLPRLAVPTSSGQRPPLLASPLIPPFLRRRLRCLLP